MGAAGTAASRAEFSYDLLAGRLDAALGQGSR